MFGIWVFTSQGAHGSLVLKCGFFISLRGLLWAWIAALSPELRLDAVRLYHLSWLSPLSLCLWAIGVLVALLCAEKDICRAIPGRQALGCGCVLQNPPYAIRVN